MHWRRLGLTACYGLACDVVQYHQRSLDDQRHVALKLPLVTVDVNIIFIFQSVQEQYDVNVTVVNFGGPLENAINLVQSSSLLLGMHGAVRLSGTMLLAGKLLLSLGV